MNICRLLVALLLSGSFAYAGVGCCAGGNTGSVATMVDKYDQNGDGVLVYEEFTEGKKNDFVVLDANKDGKLSKDELASQAMLYVVKSEGNSISEDDFVAAFVVVSVKPTEEVIEEAMKTHNNVAEKSTFKRMDANADGKVSKEELAAYYIAIYRNRQLNSSDARKDSIKEKWFIRIDDNQDGAIVLEEYID